MFAAGWKLQDFQKPHVRVETCGFFSTLVTFHQMRVRASFYQDLRAIAMSKRCLLATLLGRPAKPYEQAENEKTPC